MAALPGTPPPSTPAPRLVPARPPAPRTSGYIYFIVILLLAGTVWYFRPQRQRQPNTVVTQTVKALRGSIEATRRIAGSITATRFANVTAPILQAPETDRGLTITYLAPSGSMIKKGDLLAELDSQAMRDHLDDVEAMVVQTGLDIKKRQIDPGGADGSATAAPAFGAGGPA